METKIIDEGVIMKMLLLLSLFITTQVYSVTIEIKGQKQQILFQMQTHANLPSNLGKITVDIFDQQQIKYQGSVGGIVAMYELGNDIEVVSDTEMKAYGWCFSIDGEVPETMSDETPVLNQDSAIVWYYAYAHYKDGAWIRQCAPSL